MIIIDPNATSDFIPSSEKGPKDKRATFVVKAMTARDLFRVRSLSLSENGEEESIFYVINSCVVGWKNIVDADKKPVEFQTELMESVPAPVLTEIFEHILSISKLDGEDAKK